MSVQVFSCIPESSSVSEKPLKQAKTRLATTKSTKTAAGKTAKKSGSTGTKKTPTGKTVKNSKAAGKKTV